jgi:nitric oxide reductase large subunit
MPLIEWLRLPADLVFIVLGVMQMLIAEERRMYYGTHSSAIA